MRFNLLALVLMLGAFGCGDGRTARDGSMPPDPDGGMGPVDSGGSDAFVVPPDSPVGPTSPLVDPTCVDGMYRETLPDNTVAITDLVSGFTTAQAETFMDQVLGRRYTFGQTLARGGRE